MANSARLLVLPFFIALSLSCMNVAQGAGTARRLLQATTTNPPIFPNLPPFRGFQFPPYSGPFPEYRLPPFPGISNVPPSAPGFPGSSAPGFPGFPGSSASGFPGSFPSFPAPPTLPNTTP
ncbi:hypothetical protein ES288_D12G018600v1 [Gossypium darwinii]|uniref:Uncharacterized protein n=2 Tax=Gossypium TaxID=3633 RepID=A0A5D2I3T5_GOSTO|nr:hypothetical protein ES288_D12G018600v1 [Gossypium darwinii]TYH37101.1 hypothetical protein ES332_D12G017500v1 [Gossypium tomentosum]